METYPLSSGNSMLLFRASFWCWKPFLNTGEPILKEKLFPASGNHFLWFSCQKKQFFCMEETSFFTNTSFRVVEADFLTSTNHFLYIFCETPAGERGFFCLVETYFWNSWKLIPAIGEGFFSLMETVTLL